MPHYSGMVGLPRLGFLGARYRAVLQVHDVLVLFIQVYGN